MNPDSNENLLCTISGELLVDPITIPCGHTFSRHSLAQWFQQRQTCPLCNTEHSNFDPMTAPKNIIISHLIDAQTNKPMANKNENDPDSELDLFSAKLYILNREINQIPNTKKIAKLEISCSSKKNLGGKTLL